MDTAWIQVFVLTLAECAAPAGKTICQEREFDLQFLTRADCEVALEQLVTLKQESFISFVIVYNRMDGSQHRLNGAQLSIDGTIIGSILQKTDVSNYKFENIKKKGNRKSDYGSISTT